MTETRESGVQCGKCGLPIEKGESGIRYYGVYVAHSEGRCIDLLRTRLETAQTERAALYEIAIKAVNATDGTCVPGVSIEFLTHLPVEILGMRARLFKERDEAHERGRREGWDARGKADRQAALDYGMDETVKHSNRAVQHNAALGISHAISALPYDKEGA